MPRVPPASSTGSSGLPPIRMCTVSHCHVILSGDYEYRRCEQHRVQNRHHSKLKRVRDKEDKAMFQPSGHASGSSIADPAGDTDACRNVDLFVCCAQLTHRTTTSKCHLAKTMSVKSRTVIISWTPENHGEPAKCIVKSTRARARIVRTSNPRQACRPVPLNHPI